MQIRKAIIRSGLLVLCLSAYASSAGATGFPEFSFCPFGGPPGWMNRMTGYEGYGPYYGHPPPAYYPSPQFQPYWRNANPPARSCDPNRRSCFMHPGSIN